MEGVAAVTFVSRVPIEKGWSGDQKFCVTDGCGTKYLYRVSPAEQVERKKAEFAYMERVFALGIPMCEPIAFGQNEEGVWSVQGWIDGEDAEEALPRLSGEEQYRYGLDAGRILKRIHTLPAPPEAEDWKSRFDRKIDRKIAGYESCGLTYEGGAHFLRFLAENRHLLASRPQVWQHGDYHTGNLMIDRAGRLIVIDFNRCDWGDPWEEFNRIVWCAQLSPRFASGMVDGYFEGGEIPEAFWRLLSLYIASNTLSSLPWAIPFGEKEIAVMREQAAQVLDWYENMTQAVPKWYRRGQI